MTPSRDPEFQPQGPQSGAYAALEALKRSKLLEAAPEDRFDRITVLIRDVLDVPVCLVSLVDDVRQFFKGASGLPEPWASQRETPLSHSFCKHVVAQDAPLVVTNAERDARVIDNLAIRDLGVAAYLGVPIHIEGQAVGALCVIDRQPRLWKTSDVARLVAFGDIVDEQIAMRTIMRQRDEALRESELLAREHSHRIKNSLAVAASLVAISASESDRKEDVVRTARERISALSTAHNMVWLRDQASELGDLLKSILAPYRLKGDDMISFDGPDIRLPVSKVTPISLIFHELATNASKYGALSQVSGSVSITWRVSNDHLSVEWRETLGRGERRAPDGEAVPPSAANGFGTRLIQLCVGQLSGTIDVAIGAGGGREISLNIPWPGSRN